MTMRIARITPDSAGALAPREARVWRRSAALLASLVAVLSALILANQIYFRAYDYPTHIAWARGLPEGEFHLGGIRIGDAYRPNFLFQLLAYGLAQLPGLDVERGALAVGLLANVALALIVHALLYPVLPEPNRRRTGLAAALLVVAVMIAGPLSFLTWHRGNLYLGYIPPTVYHNPTVTLLKPLALLVFIYAVKAVRDPARRSLRTVASAALLTVLATYAKPNYTLCLLPVMAGVLALQWLRHRPVNGPLIFGGIIVPGLVALGLQYAFTYEANVENGIIFSPLTVARTFESVHIFPKLALSLVFPGAILPLYFPRARHDMALSLAWVALLVALAYAYLLAEEGMPGDGNFFWGAQVALFIVFMFSVRFFVQQIVEPGHRRPMWRDILCAGTLTLHFAAGTVWFLAEALLQQPRW